MSEPLSVPVHYRTYIAELLILLVAMGAAYTGGTLFNAKTITHSVKVHESLNAALSRAYGVPAQTLPGEQINPQLKGATCAVYAKGKSLKALVCK